MKRVPQPLSPRPPSPAVVEPMTSDTTALPLLARTLIEALQLSEDPWDEWTVEGAGVPGDPVCREGSITLPFHNWAYLSGPVAEGLRDHSEHRLSNIQELMCVRSPETGAERYTMAFSGYATTDGGTDIPWFLSLKTERIPELDEDTRFPQADVCLVAGCPDAVHSHAQQLVQTQIRDQLVELGDRLGALVEVRQGDQPILSAEATDAAVEAAIRDHEVLGPLFERMWARRAGKDLSEAIDTERAETPARARPRI